MKFTDEMGNTYLDNFYMDLEKTSQQAQEMRGHATKLVTQYSGLAESCIVAIETISDTEGPGVAAEVVEEATAIMKASFWDLKNFYNTVNADVLAIQERNLSYFINLISVLLKKITERNLREHVRKQAEQAWKTEQKWKAITQPVQTGSAIGKAVKGIVRGLGRLFGRR